MGIEATINERQLMVHEMTDRELLEECVLRMRRTEETVSQFLAAMEKNPMLRMMAGKVGM